MIQTDKPCRRASTADRSPVGPATKSMSTKTASYDPYEDIPPTIVISKFAILPNLVKKPCSIGRSTAVTTLCLCSISGFCVNVDIQSSSKEREKDQTYALQAETPWRSHHLFSHFRCPCSINLECLLVERLMQALAKFSSTLQGHHENA